MKPLAIFAIAQNIPKEVMDRQRECMRLSNPSVEYDLFHIHDPECKDNLFNKSKHLNKTIKELHSKYEVMVQCDIDLIVPPGLIDKSYEHAMENDSCFYNRHRRIDPEDLPELPKNYHKMDWERLSKYKPENANGCWNAMKSSMWIRSGGYNEWMEGWGREDDLFRQNAGKKFGIPFINYNKFCLIHYNHPFRGVDNRKFNTKMAQKAEKENKIDWLS